MTLKEIIKEIEGIAGSQPNINTILESGDIYDLNSLQNVEYGAFCLTQQQHNEDMDNDFITYVFILYYVDKLTSNRKNKVDIQSHGIDVLSNIVRCLNNNYDVALSNVTYQTFTQRFESECAGVYATLSITTSINNICGEDYE